MQCVGCKRPCMRSRLRVLLWAQVYRCCARKSRERVGCLLLPGAGGSGGSGDCGWLLPLRAGCWLVDLPQPLLSSQEVVPVHYSVTGLG